MKKKEKKESKVLQKVKNMSDEELIEYLSTDYKKDVAFRVCGGLIFSIIGAVLVFILM